MHTVFRIGEINKIDNNNLLYQIYLDLTADDDQQLRTLTEHIRKEVAGSTGYSRLGLLLVKLSQLGKAEELYKLLLEQTFDESDKVVYYSNLGFVKMEQGDYKQAIWNHEKALKIHQTIVSPDHSILAQIYENISKVYIHIGDWSKALSYCDKAL